MRRRGPSRRNNLNSKISLSTAASFNDRGGVSTLKLPLRIISMYIRVPKKAVYSYNPCIAWHLAFFQHSLGTQPPTLQRYMRYNYKTYPFQPAPSSKNHSPPIAAQAWIYCWTCGYTVTICLQRSGKSRISTSGSNAMATNSVETPLLIGTRKTLQIWRPMRNEYAMMTA